jgi:hypothetical protein
MAESICASDAPPSAPTLATMAVAAGAAVLAGAMMGRKGLAGIAAGVAALAGAKWYSGARSSGLAPPCEDTPSVVELSPEVHPPRDEPADWLDHDAVDFFHMVPDSAQAAEMLKEKTLPLLDDDGKPVEFFTLEPEFSKSLEPEPPLGPIIWKPGRFPQSASAGTSETVWFGMQDVTQAAPALPFPAPALPAPAPLEPVVPHAPFIPEPATPFAQMVAERTQPPPAAQNIVTEVPEPPMAVPPSIPIYAGLDAITHPKQGSAPVGQNPFLAPVALHPEPEPVAFHAPSAPSAPFASSAIPFSGGALGASPVSFMAAADAAAAPVVTARPAAKSSLPQPRRPGELPKHMACKVPVSGPASPAMPLAAQTSPWHAGAHSAQGQLCVEPPAPPPRHLERFAPVSLEPEEQRWPLLVLLCLIIAIGVAIAADHWQDGVLIRRVEALPWFQKSVAVDHAVASPAASTPAAAPEPAKRGTWIEPAPAPAPVK